MKAVITIGISASGKSTFAHEWKKSLSQTRVEINRDEVRKQLVEKDGNVFSWSKWNWKREGEVTKICDDNIKHCVSRGWDIVCSDTNLNKDRREQLIKKLQDLGYEVEIKDFPITWEEAVKRDNARANGVGVSVISRQWVQWIDYIRNKPHETNTDNPIDFPVVRFKKYVADTTKRKAAIFDIDGTVCKMSKDRGAFDWKLVGLDTPRHEVIDTLRGLILLGYEIIFLSGRDEVCRSETEQWIKENITTDFSYLYMRKENDMRDDRIIKKELFFKYVADNFNVTIVFDDRPKVCNLWRDLGLSVAQVSNPYIWF